MITRLSASLQDRYRIERPLGEGGMATVYLAADLKHDRKVAIKVLKPELAAVLGAQRFLAEIRTTANLQHPHILPLFDSGEAEGLLWYAMPYVEGETLRGRLDREKQLPVDEAVALVRKVAGALQAAHDRGIVHRDMKPENILLGERGEPLVSDFGIALAVQEAGGGRLTETGLSLGTPYYMSPEQATGDRLPDARSDVYALGCVLYEALTGEPPFTGSTAQAVLGRILTAEPVRPTEVRRTVPVHVEAAVLTALEKTPADRFGSAEAFAAALGDAGYQRAREAAAGSARPAPAGARRLMTWAPWAGMALLVIALLVRGSAPADDARRLTPLTAELALPEGLAVDYGSWWGALSPDGATLAYRGMDALGERLYLRDMATGSTEVLAGTEGGAAPVWSPDGSRLAFIQGRRLQLITRQGGAREALCGDRDFSQRASGAWGEDGRILMADGDGVLLWVEPGGDCTPLELPEGTWRRPHIAPGGRTAVVSLGDDQIFDLELATLDLREVGPGWEAYPTDLGFLIVVSDFSRAEAVPYDFRGRRALGEPNLLARNVGSTYNGPSFSVVGDRVVYPVGAQGEERGFRFTRLVRNGEVEDSVDTGNAWFFAASRRLPWALMGGPALSVLDLETRTVRRSGDGRGVAMALSPGDSLVAAFDGLDDGCVMNIRSAATGAKLRELVVKADDDSCIWPADWTPDGRHILGVTWGFGAEADLWLVDAESGEAERLVDEPGPVNFAALSPDGAWIAYVVDGQAVVRPLGREGRPRVASGSLRAVRVEWHPRENRLYFAALPAGVFSVDIGPDGTPVGPPVERFGGAWAVGVSQSSNSPLFQVLADGETLLLRGQSPDAARFRGRFVVIDGWSRLAGDAAGDAGPAPGRSP